MQRTRLRQVMGESLHDLALWAANPWRHVSLLAVVFTTAFLLGSSITTVSGSLNLLDPMVAVVTMVLTEVLVRQRPRLRRQANHLWLHLVDSLRVGFLYGVILDGFRLMT
ncbi:MAG: DUF565 domain-containing protein [Synechococcus sp. SB0678_bin_12]|nr:DUF565 domain-containing protein [Synechococcus sp. SB0678_bin_12]MYI88517.1 DUF565 domain-containing protein [Synechococcus sp. SB0672_bin_10]